MEIKHYINGVEIDEPIGFDSLKMVMKRGEYHGMSAELSEQTLEFYGQAAELIHDAYENDIDTELIYSFSNDGYDVWRGVIDLSTYEEQKSEYHSVSCKVGEAGIMTIFNNRLDVEVDLTGSKTIDGMEYATKYQFKKLSIPQMPIEYLNNVKLDKLYSNAKEYIPSNFRWAFIQIPINSEKTINEFGTINNDIVFSSLKVGKNKFNIVGQDNIIPNINSYFDSYYNSPNEFKDYDESSLVEITYRISGSISFYTDLYESGIAGANMDIYPQLVINGKPKTDGYSIRFTNKNFIFDRTFDVEGTITTSVGSLSSLHFGLFIKNNAFEYGSFGIEYVNNSSKIKLVIDDTTYFSMKLKSNRYVESYANVIFVHEALCKIVDSISNSKLSVKSSIYGRFDSQTNKYVCDKDNPTEYQKKFGDGALKAISNGYNIRGVNNTVFNMSFGELIDSLDAIDCIGFGFVIDEGSLLLMVEKWDFFYKDEVLFEISNPNEIKCIFDDSMVITNLTIGYKKYSTSEDVQSMNSIFGDRTFISNIKSITKSKDKRCDFIADNYAIEETRRAGVNLNPEEEFKYDENVFVFSVLYDGYEGKYYIGYDEYLGMAEDYETIKTGGKFNIKISPARNAFRWAERLFCVKGMSKFLCSSANGFFNTSVVSVPEYGVYEEFVLYSMPDKFNDIPKAKIFKSDGSSEEIVQNAEDYTIRERYCIEYYKGDDGTENEVTSEDDLLIDRKFKAEEISFTYPLTIAQYKAIKENPYGLIEVDGIQGWIKEFTYKFVTGEADFKLIRKA